MSAACALLFIVLALVTCCGTASAGALLPPPLALSGGTPISLAGHLQLLEDPSAQLTLQEVVRKADSPFRNLEGFLHSGYTAGASWVRCVVRRGSTGGDDFFLRVAPATLDEVTVFVQEKDDPSDPASFHRYDLGDRHPPAQRPVLLSELVVPIEVPGESARLIYIRVRGSRTHDLSAQIYTPQALATWSERHSTLNGCFYGIAAVVCFINAFHAFRLREMLYGCYALYVLAVLAAYAGAEGLAAMLWPSQGQVVSDYAAAIGACLSVSALAAFAMRLFKSRKMPLTHRCLKASQVFGIAAGCSVALPLYPRVAALVQLNGTCLLVGLVVLSHHFLRTKAAGTAFFAAFACSAAGAAMDLLRLAGDTLVTWGYAPQAFAVAGMVLMTFALTERVHAAELHVLEESRAAERSAMELANDITRELLDKQRDLEDALATERAALKTQVRFVEMVSHEYRTPIAIIRTNLDILEMKAGSAEAAIGPNLQKMKRALARLVEVVEVSLGRDRLIDFHGRMSRDEIRLPLFLEIVVGELKELHGHDRLQLELRESFDCTITGDRSMLKTVFLNIIDNALKYSGETGAVQVCVEKEGEWGVVRVTDRGRGIPTEELEQVFEKYFRGAGTADIRGAGLGLHLVKRIVEQHRGRVSLASSPADGTVASVWLPLHGGGKERAWAAASG